MTISHGLTEVQPPQLETHTAYLVRTQVTECWGDEKRSADCNTTPLRTFVALNMEMHGYFMTAQLVMLSF